MLLSSWAFTFATFFLTSLKALDIFVLLVIANHDMKISIKKTTRVSLHSIVESITTEPTSIITERNISSGPW